MKLEKVLENINVMSLLTACITCVYSFCTKKETVLLYVHDLHFPLFQEIAGWLVSIVENQDVSECVIAVHFKY